MVTYPFPLFVLGVMKAGTTALCDRLFQHPNLVTAHPNIVTAHPIAAGAPPGQSRGPQYMWVILLACTARTHINHAYAPLALRPTVLLGHEIDC
jgi:hypothetical protein